MYIPLSAGALATTDGCSCRNAVAVETPAAGHEIQGPQKGQSRQLIFYTVSFGFLFLPEMTVQHMGISMWDQYPENAIGYI